MALRSFTASDISVGNKPDYGAIFIVTPPPVK